MKYCIPFFCLLIFAACDNEKVHLNENGQKTAIYQGKRLAESYSYHETKPDILAKNTVYNEDQSVVTKNYNEKGALTRVDSNAVSGDIEKLYYNHAKSPTKISRREFYGTDSLYMCNYDTLGAETAVIIQSKRFTQRLYRGNSIFLHEKVFTDGKKSEWDYHPNGNINKYKLSLEKENVSLFELYNIQGQLLNKRISVNGFHSMYNNNTTANAKDSLLLFFDMKKTLDKSVKKQIAASDVLNASVDKKAKYPKGKKALKKFLSSRIAYSQEGLTPKQCDQINIRLFIDKSGKAYVAENPNCMHFDILRKVYKAVAEMPNWEAATSNGKAVASIQKFPLAL